MLVSNDNKYRKDNEIHLQGKVEQGMRPVSSWSCKWSSLSWNLEGRAMSMKATNHWLVWFCRILKNKAASRFGIM